MAKIPTIKIQDGDGVSVINADEFDPTRHICVDAAEAESSDPEPVAGKRKPGRPKKK